jgi:hypothetical protein
MARGPEMTIPSRRPVPKPDAAASPHPSGGGPGAPPRDDGPARRSPVVRRRVDNRAATMDT